MGCAACGSAGSETPGTHTGSGPPAAPEWATDFAADEGKWDVIARGGGRVAFGVPEARAGDGVVATLLYPGAAELGPADHVGPPFATEIDTRRRFLFGTFRTRVQLAACRPGEEVVNGIFTYFNDGTDGNGNGIADNSEIDVEILCGTPSVVSLTVWTDYQSEPERFVKRTRAIDLQTGEYFESPSDHEYGLVPAGTSAELRHPGFPDPEAFYEIGWEWRATSVRYFAVLDGREVTLWNLAEPRYVPQRPAAWLFNVWHPRQHWFGGGGDADYPAGDAVMRVDWARYWSN